MPRLIVPADSETRRQRVVRIVNMKYQSDADANANSGVTNVGKMAGIVESC